MIAPSIEILSEESWVRGLTQYTRTSIFPNAGGCVVGTYQHFLCGAAKSAAYNYERSDGDGCDS